MAVAAFFDIDGTLIARNSAPLYMRHLRETGQARRRDLARTFYYFGRCAAAGANIRLKLGRYGVITPEEARRKARDRR